MQNHGLLFQQWQINRRPRDEDITRYTDILASLIDLTLLDKEARQDQIGKLLTKAEQYQVAAICMYPEHYSNLPQTTIKKATVVNFPDGEQPLTQVLNEMEEAITQYQINEIDYVFPYQTYHNNQETEALKHYQQVLRKCKEYDVSFKVILETGFFHDKETIYRLAREVLESPCDFLKTSTGKIAQGASPLAAFCLLSAIKDSNSTCGIKLSGGIKTVETAYQYMHMAEVFMEKPLDDTWFRIGASSLVDELSIITCDKAQKQI